MFTREEMEERLYNIFMRKNKHIFEDTIFKFTPVTTEDVLVEFTDGRKLFYNCADGFRRTIFYENEYRLTDKQIMSEFIIRFERLLEIKRIGKNVLSDKLGIACQSLSRYSNHKAIPKITILPALANELGCRIQDFFYTEKPYRLDGVPDLLDEVGIRFYFARKLRDCIVNRNCLRDLANHAEVSERTIFRYLNGETAPNIVILKRIADYFDKNIEYFFGTKERNY